MDKPNAVTVETVVNAPIEKVWEYWTAPEHITKWAFASDDWAAPRAQNDVRVGGRFMIRMEAKDGSTGFDFGGVYTAVKEHELIEYDMDADETGVPRHVRTVFTKVPNPSEDSTGSPQAGPFDFAQDKSGQDGVKITQTFDPETENPIEMQRAGWQAILDNFKKHTESQ